MKKISIVLIILILIPAAMGALEQEVHLQSLQDGVLLDIRILNLDKQILFDTINDGLRCGIRFRFQIFQKKAAIADKFISEVIVDREGKWDPFSESYLISQNNTLFDSAQTLEGFFNKFTSLRNYFIPFEKSEETEYYILCRVQIETVKLVPPFQILSPGMNLTFPATSWKNYAIE